MHPKRFVSNFWGAVQNAVAGLLIVYRVRRLVGQLGRDKLAVEASDVGDRLVLGAYSLASTGIGTVTKAQLVHLGYHSLGALGCLGTALGQKSQLTYLRAYEEHG